jgi:DNA-binding transcriptional LysR family regulator
LRLGVITTAKYFAPEILGEFCKLYPGIEVALKVSNRDRIIERINANEDDLYIMGQTPDEQFEVDAIPFAPNPLVVMAPRNHPLVGKKNVPLSSIVDEPFILREPGSGIRDATLKLFDQLGQRPQVRMELGSNEAIKHAIVGGLGLSVLSLHTLTLEGTDGPVAILDIEGFPIMREWYLVYPKGKELSLVAQAFLDYALEIEPGMRERMALMWPRLNKFLKTGRKKANPARRAKKA